MLNEINMDNITSNYYDCDDSNDRDDLKKIGEDL